MKIYSGSIGCGKTTKLVSLANKCLEEGGTPIFLCSVDGADDALRAHGLDPKIEIINYSTYSKNKNKYRGYDIFIDNIEYFVNDICCGRLKVASITDKNLETIFRSDWDKRVLSTSLSNGNGDGIIETAVPCIICGEEAMRFKDSFHRNGPAICQHCKDAILAMRKLIPEDKEILTCDEAGECRYGDKTISVVPPAHIQSSEYYSWYLSGCNLVGITFEQLSYAMQMHPGADIFIIRKKVRR